MGAPSPIPSEMRNSTGVSRFSRWREAAPRVPACILMPRRPGRVAVLLQERSAWRQPEHTHVLRQVFEKTNADGLFLVLQLSPFTWLQTPICDCVRNHFVIQCKCNQSLTAVESKPLFIFLPGSKPKNVARDGVFKGCLKHADLLLINCKHICSICYIHILYCISSVKNTCCGQLIIFEVGLKSMGFKFIPRFWKLNWLHKM